MHILNLKFRKKIQAMQLKPANQNFLFFNKLELPAAVRLFTFIVMDFSSILILFWNANYVESLVMFDCVQYL